MEPYVYEALGLLGTYFFTNPTENAHLRSRPLRDLQPPGSSRVDDHHGENLRILKERATHAQRRKHLHQDENVVVDRNVELGHDEDVAEVIDQHIHTIDANLNVERNVELRQDEDVAEVETNMSKSSMPKT